MEPISPLDGRYQREVAPLARFFSEEALNVARLEVELTYLVALAEFGITRPLTKRDISELQRIGRLLPRHKKRLKEIEQLINHDTKAVEYFIRENLKGTAAEDLIPFVHLGLTTADIDNLAWGTLFQTALRQQVLPLLAAIQKQIGKMAKEYESYSMVGRTHGQPAVPTTIGHELWVFTERLAGEIEKLRRLKVPGKLTGTVGTLAAHYAAYPDRHWHAFAKTFVGAFGLNPKEFTTQIPPYEDLCEIFDGMRRINTIILDLDRDIWDYLSRGYFTLAVKEQEVGSSTMPQKVNPIDFERSEAYLKVANALFEMLSRELPQNRLQRDLTEKYLLRVVGEAVGFSFLSYGATRQGLGKINADRKALEQDLLKHWEILSEAIQTILRKHRHQEAFELIKRLTRGRVLREEEYRQMLAELKPQISPAAFAEIEKLHPLEVLKWE